MEHLPRRIGQEKSIFPAIPYLCREKYDGGPFLDYPRRSGLLDLENDVVFRMDATTLSFPNRKLLATMPRAQLEPFLQNWLFFGLLHEVLGGLYRHEEFVTTLLDGENGKSIITTTDLVSRLEEWVARATQDKASLTAVCEHIATCLKITLACLFITIPTFDGHLKFHLASVAELVRYAASKACNVAWTNDLRRTLITMPFGHTISDDFWKFVLLERSTCCPSQVHMLLQDFRSLQALGFIASCFYEDNVQTYHASCDEHICRAGDSRTPGQITRHVSESCECKFVHVDEEELVDCLKNKCLPLLRLRKESNMGEMSIEIVPSTRSTSYVALSHVWVDGLGNHTATALPRCQLSRLKALIDNLRNEYLNTSVPLDDQKDTSEMLLWCDTLCCPVVSLEGKNMALKQMYRTYNEASVVLVLDRGLVSNRVGSMGIDEACLRIATSRWMTRLWTLQEGALPARTNKLWFQFTKRALSSWTLLKHLTKISKTDIQRQEVVESVIGRFLSFITLFDTENIEIRGAHLENVMSGLNYRSVTIPSDEPLIIATLLDFNLEKILESEPAEKRMKVLWEIMGTSPSGIDKRILFHIGPKIHERGFRWALQSLLSVDGHFATRISIEPKDRGILATNGNAKGLVVELAGFRISFAKPAKGLPKLQSGFNSIPGNHDHRHLLLLKDCQGHWYMLGDRLFKADEPRSGVLEEMCAVISDLSNPWVLYEGSSSPIPEYRKAYNSLLVEPKAKNKQQSQNNEFTCVEIKSQVVFRRIDADMNGICQAAYHLTQELISSAAGHRLEELGTGSVDMEDPVYQQALGGVSLELERLSKSPFAVEALAASGDIAHELGSSIANYMERFYKGAYLQIEEYATGDRKWCVD